MPNRNLVVLILALLASFACYERASRNRFVSTLTDAMNLIHAHYVEEVPQRALFEGAMDGMLGQLDQYSGYTSPEDYRQLQENLDQEFGGVGIVVEVNTETKRLTVMSPLVGTPAHKAGLRPGDMILQIDGQDTEGMTLKDAVNLMRGPAGSQVRLQVQHAGDSEPSEFVLERAIIPIESVLGDSRRDDGSWDYRLAGHPELAYVRLTQFGEHTAEELGRALDAVNRASPPAAGLILDVRGNAGGLLKTAVEICDMFLDEGVIVTTRGRRGDIKEEYVARPGTKVPRHLPIVVLVDRFSASASEILAACLQDHRRADIVGQRTWGKGTVQNVIGLEGGKSALRLTVASYWRPSGQNIHKRRDAADQDEWGVRPNSGLEVNLTDEEFERVVKARRQRDLREMSKRRPLEDKAPAGQNAPRPPAEQPAENQPADDKPADDEAAVDPQLEKAIQRLQELIQQADRNPRKA